METLEQGTGSTRRNRRIRGSSSDRRPVSIVGVLGEVLLTLGVVVLLYVAWQLWIGDLIYGAQADSDGQALSEQWDRQYEEMHEPSVTASPTASDPAPAVVEPPLLPQPSDAETFAIMRIPRFGADYFFDIAGGTTRSRTLDTARIGHYTGTEMPGQLGNFALAGHRTTFGAPFNRLPDLRVNDAIVIETPEGWYTYRFRNLTYVKPTQVEVLLDVPEKPDVPAGDRYITTTACSPIGSLAERIVAYGTFEEYTPRTAAPPESLTTPSP